jgi:hypothetical protein
MATKDWNEELRDACSKGDFNTVEKAVASGADVNVGVLELQITYY